MKKNLELNYKIKIDFEKKAGNSSRDRFSNLIISDCPEEYIQLIEGLIKSECNNKKVKTIKLEYMPGIELVFDKNNVAFKQAINNILSKLIN